MKHHVHIYATMAMAEVDVEADSPEEARKKVKEEIHKHDRGYPVDWKKPDTDHIAVTFEDK